MPILEWLFNEIKVYVVFLVLSLVFKSVLKEYSDPKLGIDLLEIKNIILEAKFPNKFKNGHENFMVLAELIGFSILKREVPTP
jgi:hypothetical protein